MTAYVIVGALVTWALGWLWFTYLFPKVHEELSGSPTGGQGTRAVLALLVLLVLAAAVGTFIKNRNVLNLADALRLGFKIWIGFLMPVIVMFWATTRKALNAHVATAGYWLVTVLLLAILADWMLV